MNCWPPKASVKLYWQVSACPCGAFSATQTYRHQAANVSKKKTAKAVVTKTDVKACPHMLECLDARVLRHACGFDFKRQSCPLVSMPKAMGLIEVSLELSSSADVQGNAMRPAAQHFGVAQFQGDYINTLLFQKLDESRLISIDHDQIRIDAECIHVDPVAPDAFG